MVVLITGASGGLGSVLATTLKDRGMTVYGTMRDPSHDAHDRDFTMLPMEIGDSDSVNRCIEQVLEREGRIDVVVGCVNRMLIGSLEETSAEEMKSLYDTNVFGALRVCKAVLPAMRAQGRGTIVSMSSLGGLLAVPYMSAYTSSKFALEAMSEALHHEVRRHGIDVVIMQPVAMAMDRPATGAHLELVAGAGPDSFSHKMLERMARDTAASKLTPQQVAEKIHEVITRRKKPLRVPLDRARLLSVVKRLAPQAVIDRLMGGLMQ
jgi:short-subunit dehydrogenase